MKTSKLLVAKAYEFSKIVVCQCGQGKEDDSLLIKGEGQFL